MSNITLYYVQGITKVDTPVFDTIQNQRLFFSEQDSYVVPYDSFYVPKFKDEIKLEVSVLDFNSTVNYLKLEFNNKEYYYFVSSVKYISEDIISITIEMDVIQTYMFDIEFNHSEISRETIKRWLPVGADLYKINRNYIRENIGNTNKLCVKYDVTNPGYYALIIHIMPTGANKYWYQYENNVPVLETFSGNEITKVSYSDKSYVEAGIYLVLPISSNNVSGTTYVSARNTVNLTGRVWKLIRNMCERDYVLSVDVISGRYLSAMGITYNSANDTFTCSTANSAFIRIYDGASSESAPDPECAGFVVNVGGTAQEITIPTISRDYTPITFTRNTSASATFDWHFCPQLLDENYTEFLYGEPSFLTGYPLSKLEYPVIHLATTCDLINNIRTYMCDYSPNYDRYLTLKYATSPQHLDLYNNPYQSYLSRNQATLSAGRALALAHNVYQGVSDYGSGKKSGGMAIADTVASEIEYEWRRQIKLDDLKYTPDTLKVNGNGVFDYVTTNIEERTIVNVVTNIEHCAEYFESFGYSNHRITSENLFAINNRYYYDFITVSNMNFDLLVLSDMETKSKIFDRFKGGLRMWHTTNGVLNCLSVAGVLLNMGQLCLYDNVENY